MDFTAVKKSSFFHKECNENKSKVGVDINFSLYKNYIKRWMDLEAVKTFASMFKEP